MYSGIIPYVIAETSAKMYPLSFNDINIYMKIKRRNCPKSTY
ncbi:hypothetical protein CCAND95_130018 [Capnocytophaga canis]|nr:hypothetical protein CCAND95_130018 [Capnocytophaga canis]